MAETLISVIIPAQNEASNLKRLLPTLLSISGVEVITVDGQSEDDSLQVARNFLQENALVASKPNRAGQQNQGAQHAKGGILFFLYADSTLPTGWAEEIQRLLQKEEVIAGSFRFKTDSKHPILLLVEIGVWLRCFFKGMPYGDQGIFLRKGTFEQLGGFPTVPILEDILLIKKLKTIGKVAMSSLPLLTSSRRWKKLGVIKTTLRNQKILYRFKKTGKFDNLRNYYDQP